MVGASSHSCQENHLWNPARKRRKRNILSQELDFTVKVSVPFAVTVRFSVTFAVTVNVTVTVTFSATFSVTVKVSITVGCSC